MLQAIRDNAQGWIAWVIVGLIILTFALFGIDQYARGDKVVVVAEVNGEEVTANEFLTLYNRQKNRLEQQFGEMYDQVVNDEDLRGQVMDALVESEVIRQWSEDQSMSVSDQQLAMTIQSADVFQQDGKFDQKLYEEILMRNGLNVARFEYEQRQFLIENQFKMLTQSSSFATQMEIDQLSALQGQERNVNYLRVDQRPFLKTVEITDAQVEEAYNTNRADYVEPEKVVLEYVELSQNDIAAGIEVNDSILQGFYEENQSLFMMPEKRQAKHILISMVADTVEAEAAAMKTIKEVQEKIAAGDSFEALAKMYSQDPGSAQSGGDLGSFEQGMMVPEFDEAVFAMQVGDVSEPVKTDFGFHLIKLVGIDAASVQPLADIKTDVTKEYQMQEAERQYFDLLEQVNTIAYEQSDSLQPVAEATGLTVSTSESVGREGGAGKVLGNNKVMTTAFSEEVLKSGMNSSSIDLGVNHAVVIRVKEHIEAREKPLTEVATGIKENLQREAAIAESAKLGEELLAKVKAGENPESLMRDGVEWNTVGWVNRNNQQILPQITNEFFKVAKPETGKSSWGSMQLSTGDTLVLQVTELRDVEVNAGQKSQLEGAMNELMAGNEIDLRIQSLLAQADVVKKEIYKTIK